MTMNRQLRPIFAPIYGQEEVPSIKLLVVHTPISFFVKPV